MFLTSTHKKILDVMKQNSVKLKPKQISELGKIPHQTVKQAMRTLVLSGLVTQGKRWGGYELTKKGEEAV